MDLLAQRTLKLFGGKLPKTPAEWQPFVLDQVNLVERGSGVFALPKFGDLEWTIPGGQPHEFGHDKVSRLYKQVKFGTGLSFETRGIFDYDFFPAENIEPGKPGIVFFWGFTRKSEWVDGSIRFKKHRIEDGVSMTLLTCSLDHLLERGWGHEIWLKLGETILDWNEKQRQRSELSSQLAKVVEIGRDAFSAIRGG